MDNQNLWLVSENPHTPELNYYQIGNYKKQVLLGSIRAHMPYSKIKITDPSLLDRLSSWRRIHEHR